MCRVVHLFVHVWYTCVCQNTDTGTTLLSTVLIINVTNNCVDKNTFIVLKFKKELQTSNINQPQLAAIDVKNGKILWSGNKVMAS